MASNATPEPSVPSLRPSYLVDQVITVLRERISSGAYKANDRLPGEMELARQFNVGRSTVREALRVLSHVGLVETLTGRGTFVLGSNVHQLTDKEISLQEVGDILRFRFVIEIDAAQQAAEKRSEEDMTHVLAAFEAFKRSAESGIIEEIVQRDFDLHLSIVVAGGNHYAAKLYRAHAAELCDATRGVIRQGVLSSSGTLAKTTVNLHDVLISAIGRQDPRAAVSAVKRDRREAEILLALTADVSSSSES